MTCRMPITNVEQLKMLDDKETLEGYYDGFAGEPEPGDNRSISYWHGWRNGASDKGYRKQDTAQMLLAHDVIQKKYLEWK